MKRKINQRDTCPSNQSCHACDTENKVCQNEYGNDKSDGEVKETAKAFSKSDDDRTLATDTVLLPISIVVDDEECINGNTADEAQ